ncbi:MAG: tetratricopeptide repeat protein [Gemmatimonadales bacterium]
MSTLEQGSTDATALDPDSARLAEQYHAALSRNPDDPGALHGLGCLMGQLGQHDLELALIGQAIARAPDEARFHEDLGLALLAAGHRGDAEEAFDEALRLDGGRLHAAAGLADIMLDRGETERARVLLSPESDAGWAPRARGRLALADQRWSDAVTDLLIHLGQSPVDSAGLFYLGVGLQSQELFDAAVIAYSQAISVDPDLFEAHANLGTVLTALGRYQQALTATERAVELAPGRPGVYLNRANARRELGDVEGALADLQRAVALEPGYAEAWSTLGNLLHDQGRLAEALSAHNRAVTAAPELAQARWNRSFTLLASGALGAGWDEYEWRHLTSAARPEPRSLPWPSWQGESPAGARIFVWREQGIGDELLFLTCLPDLVEAGAQVTVAVSERLVSMVARAFPAVRVVADDLSSPPAGEFDWQIGLASLPRWLRRTRASFPPARALLSADPVEVERWRERLASLGHGRKVGICWRSGLVTPDRQRQYAPLVAFRALVETPGITWINLQYDDCEAELAAIENQWGRRIHRWPEVDLRNDLESVIGLLANLDAVVTAPTAVSSLAGAVGCPTWQVDSGSDWTVFGGSRSPWFPSIRVAALRPGEADHRRVMAEIQAGLAGQS